MGLKERIEGMTDEWLEGNPHWDDGYERARKQAAQIAAEADALMEEMTESVEGLLCAMRLAGWDDDVVAERGRQVLEKYNQYKEQTNEQ